MLLSNKFVSPPSEGDNGLLRVKSNVLSPHRAAFAHAAQAALFMCIHVFAKSPLFFPTLKNAALFRQTRPGWVWLPWTLCLRIWSDCIATQIGQCNQYIIPALSLPGHIEPSTTHQSMQYLGVGKCSWGWTCGCARWMGFLAQKVEHQRTKLKVAGSSPAEVHFFSYPEKCRFIQTNQARLGLVAPGLK